MPEVLSQRQFNRALLGRQLLLERQGLGIVEAVEHLVGMQAQEPWDPYVGLWSRLSSFDPKKLGGLLESRELVRGIVMRGTVHLMSPRDALHLRGVMDSVLSGTFRSQGFAKGLAGADTREVVAAARELTRDEPMLRSQIGKALAPRWPDADPDSLGFVAQYMLPLVQAPPRAVWGKKGQSKLTPMESWLGGEVEWDADPALAVERYLRAYGPAAPKDVRAWSYRTGLPEVIKGMRDRLRVFESEGGTELLDVEDGLLPDPEMPAPVRFLPEYDNALLSFADRSRFTMPGEKARPYWKGSVLVDGIVSATWKPERRKDGVTVAVLPWRKLTGAERAEVEGEGAALARFLADGADSDVRIEPVA